MATKKQQTPSKLNVTPASPLSKSRVTPNKATKGLGKALNTTITSSEAPRGNNSVKAGLQFSVPRIARFMKQGRFSARIGGGAPVYLASAIQYICSEIIELAGNEAESSKVHRITSRHVMLAIKKDVELNKLIGNADFPDAGVMPNINKNLTLGKKGKGKGKCMADDDEEMDVDDQ